MSMTYKELKEMLDKFSPEQLEQPVVIFHEEESFSILDIVDRAWAENPCRNINPRATEMVIVTSEL
jgi:hypothetical protein